MTRDNINYIYKVFDCNHVFDDGVNDINYTRCSKCKSNRDEIDNIKRYYTVEFREFKFLKLLDKL